MRGVCMRGVCSVLAGRHWPRGFPHARPPHSLTIAGSARKGTYSAADARTAASCVSKWCLRSRHTLGSVSGDVGRGVACASNARQADMTADDWTRHGIVDPSSALRKCLGSVSEVSRDRRPLERLEPSDKESLGGVSEVSRECLFGATASVAHALVRAGASQVHPMRLGSVSEVSRKCLGRGARAP